ncbi:MAG: 50S ribosomal protein L29 [Desulfurococcales archaeon]|nr:50S ribosomal protein L29 [Desulfurococcales archaeon]
MAKHRLKPKEIREMSPDERAKTLREFRVELITLRHKAAVGALENPGRLRELRRNIARILTIEREEEKRRAGKG